MGLWEKTVLGSHENDKGIESNRETVLKEGELTGFKPSDPNLAVSAHAVFQWFAHSSPESDPFLLYFYTFLQREPKVSIALDIQHIK